MLALLFCSAFVVADGGESLARADAGEVYVSVDGGGSWALVHECADSGAHDGAGSSCPELALEWYGPVLYIACPSDGLYEWQDGAIESVAVAAIDALADPCDAVEGRADESPTWADERAMRSVFGRGARAPPLRPPALDLVAMTARAHRARWLPRLEVGVARSQSSVRDAHASAGWKRSSTTEIWMWLSWDLDRNHYFTWERLLR